MAEEFNLEEMVRPFNLSSAEMDKVKEKHATEKFDKSSLEKFIYRMRAISASEKEPSSLQYYELQDALKGIKNVKDNDKELVEAKAKLLNSSEQILSQVRPEDLNNMGVTAELSEWININNSQDLDATQKERNQQYQNQITNFNNEYDKIHGLAGISPQDAENILRRQEELENTYSGMDPFATDEKGALLNPIFANSAAFYNRLTLWNGQDKCGDIERLQYIKQMSDLARQETITELMTNPKFSSLPQDKQDELFAQTYAGYLEQGAAALLLDKYLERIEKDYKDDPQRLQELRDRAPEAMSQIIQNATQSNDPIAIDSNRAEQVYVGRLNAASNVSKRIAQKTEKRNIFEKIYKKKKEWEERNPKLAFVANIGLTIGANVLGGGVGLAVLGAYRTYEAYKKADDERRKYNAENQEQQSFLKYIWKNKRHLVSIAGSLASTVLSGYSGLAYGAEANGMVGQAIHNGVGQSIDNMGQAISSSWEGLTQAHDNIAESAKNFSFDKVTESVKNFSLEDAGNTIANKAKNMFTGDGLRIARNIRSFAVAGGTFALDMADVFKPENKGKRGKMFMKALGKATLTFGAVFATTPVENAESSVSEHSNLKGNDTTQSNSTLPPRVSVNEEYDYTKPLWQDSQNQTWTPHYPMQENIPTSDNYVEDPLHMANTETSNSSTITETTNATDNTQFWENRSHKFLEERTGNSEAITKRVYDMIDNKEITLPEGIESKEEYLYKMVMAMEQRPADLHSALGGEWKSSAEWEKSLLNMKAEEFNQISSAFDNEYSDRGYYQGGNSGATPTHTPSENEGNGIVTNTDTRFDIKEIAHDTLSDVVEELNLDGVVIDGHTVGYSMSEYDALIKDGKYTEATALLHKIYDASGKMYDASGNEIPFEKSELAKADADYHRVLTGSTNNIEDEAKSEESNIPVETKLSKVPSHEQMQDFAKDIRQHYQAGDHIGKTVREVIQENVDNGSMTAEQAAMAGHLFHETYNEHGGNISATLRDIEKNSAELAQQQPENLSETQRRIQGTQDRLFNKTNGENSSNEGKNQETKTASRVVTGQAYSRYPGGSSYPR